MLSEILELSPNKFPPLLREIPDKPKRLFFQGKLPESEMLLLCVVGSRKYSQYGKDVCEKLISELAGYNVGIVSGLALGIDSIAHKAALRHGLYTMAVPGSGLSEKVLYPRLHVRLAKDILEKGGALLSEFTPETPAAPYTFPQRNRIMAGISHAILIIEAEERSGTLITARLGLEYNREVLTVPGSIYRTSSYGPHMLIRTGATPITSGEDILEACGIEAKEKKGVPEDLSLDEQKICGLLGEPLTKDELLELLDIPVQEAQILLSAMEIKGLITTRMGKLQLTQ